MFAELDLNQNGKVLVNEMDPGMDAYLKFSRSDVKYGNAYFFVIINEFLIKN